MSHTRLSPAGWLTSDPGKPPNGTGPIPFLVYAHMKFLPRGPALALSCVAAACFSAACTVRLDSQSQIVREEKRFTVKGTPVVHATTFDGAIQIQSWDKPEVVVEIEKRGATREAVDALIVKASQSGDSIDVEVQKPPDAAL